MILDKLEDVKSKYDVCIVGAGPSGLILSEKLSKKLNILIIEGGSFEISDKSQEIYSGQVIGDNYFDLSTTRLRYFGGSSNHWGGWVRNLEEDEFEKIESLKVDEWPIKKKDLDKYLDVACGILKIKNNFQSENFIKNSFNKVNYSRVEEPHLFSKPYIEKFAKSKNIDLCLNTNLINAEIKNNFVTKIIVSNFKNLKKKINSKKFIIAAGGLENSRILLWIKKNNPNSFFSKISNIGTYFLEHPHIHVGHFITKINDVERKDADFPAFFLHIDKEKKNNFNILGSAFRFYHYPGSSSISKKIIAELSCLAPKYLKNLYNIFDKKLICTGKLFIVSEQHPNINNRIELDHGSLDIFGIPKIKLFWKKNTIDKKTISLSSKFLAEEFSNKNFGRISLSNTIYNDDLPKNENDGDYIGGNHHMGGTRMSNDYKKGVVNSDLKIWGINNMYVCGSSVFPRGGTCNPTLSIIQLSLRLADHINSKFS